MLVKKQCCVYYKSQEKTTPELFAIDILKTQRCPHQFLSLSNIHGNRMSEGKSRARERLKQFIARKDGVINVENKSSTAGMDVHQSVSQISACLDKHAAFSGVCLGFVIARENFKVMEGVLM